MSRYVWIAAAALIGLTVGILWWADRSSTPPNSSAGDPRVAVPTMPVVRVPDGGRLWRPHPDRAGMLRHRVTD